MEKNNEELNEQGLEFYKLKIYKDLKDPDASFDVISLAIRHPKREIREIGVSHPKLSKGQRIYASTNKDIDIRRTFYERKDLTENEILQGLNDENEDIVIDLLTTANIPYTELIKQQDKFFSQDCCTFGAKLNTIKKINYFLFVQKAMDIIERKINILNKQINTKI